MAQLAAIQRTTSAVWCSAPNKSKIDFRCMVWQFSTEQTACGYNRRWSSLRPKNGRAKATGRRNVCVLYRNVLSCISKAKANVTTMTTSPPSLPPPLSGPPKVMCTFHYCDVFIFLVMKIEMENAFRRMKNSI